MKKKASKKVILLRCDYCNGKAELVNGATVYPHRPDPAAGSGGSKRVSIDLLPKAKAEVDRLCEVLGITTPDLFRHALGYFRQAVEEKRPEVMEKYQLKSLPENGSGSTANINAGRIWAEQMGADVISESLGDPDQLRGDSGTSMDGWQVFENPPLDLVVQAGDEWKYKGAGKWNECDLSVGKLLIHGFVEYDKVQIRRRVPKSAATAADVGPCSASLRPIGRPVQYAPTGIAASPPDGPVANFSSVSFDEAAQPGAMVECLQKLGWAIDVWQDLSTQPAASLETYEDWLQHHTSVT